MARKISSIPNPNKISNNELNFLKQSSSDFNTNVSPIEIDKYKGRMISMSDSFYAELNNYLKLNPTEGNRSSFIVRVVADYMRNRNEKII